ncbi:MAG: hypothetical protein A2Y71_12085 [Bacteroidetes bacterium RBG_13_42_15]|nr:MAG: hypothetical protein A2Y71_12085 [Bacteroidetes bacterium RBG_13_42_15]
MKKILTTQIGTCNCDITPKTKIMKTKLLIIFLVTICSVTLRSQTSEKITGFSDIRFSYFLSSMSAGGYHFKKGETIIPYGTGLELTYNLSKRFSTDFGIGFRTTGKRIVDSFIMSEFGYSGPIHNESRDIYLDIPVHIRFKLLNTRPFKIFIASGPKGTITHVNYYYNPGYDGQEQRYKGTTFSAGIDFGIIESLKINNRAGIFISQFYGYYLTGDLSELEFIDLKIGLTYYFK